MIRSNTVGGLVLFAGLLSWAIGCSENSVSTGRDTGSRDGVLVHITHGNDDPHAVLMGLKKAVMMSEDHDVLVYFDVKGVEVVLKEAPDLAHAPFPSSKTQLKDLMEKGVGLLACPGCLKAAGKKPEDLMPGVQVAVKDAFFDFTRGRILTFAY